MKIIIVAASALLVAAGSAVAERNHYGSSLDYPQSGIDRSNTSSTGKPGEIVRKTAPSTVYKPVVPKDDYGQGHWGNR